MTYSAYSDTIRAVVFLSEALCYYSVMGNFNYMSPTPWSNPAGVIEKTTNEIPTKMKAKTTSRKAKKGKKKEDKSSEKAEKQPYAIMVV